MGTFENPEVVQEELDILLIGGGMACCGAAYEMMRWAEAVKAETGTELRIKLVDKAAMDRSGAVAQGLSAINTYIGPEQDPADYARMVVQRPDGHHARRLGLRPRPPRRRVGAPVRGMGPADLEDRRRRRAPRRRRVAEGRPARAEGRRQAGALGQVADHDQRRVLQVDRRRGGEEGARPRAHPGARLHRQAGERRNDPSRIAGAVGFSVRENSIYIYKAKAVLLAAGGASTCSARARSAKASAAPGIRRGTPARPTRWPPRPAPNMTMRKTASCRRASRTATARSAPGSCCSRPRPINAIRRGLHGQEQGAADQYPPYGQAARAGVVPAQSPDARRR